MGKYFSAASNRWSIFTGRRVRTVSVMCLGLGARRLLVTPCSYFEVPLIYADLWVLLSAVVFFQPPWLLAVFGIRTVYHAMPTRARRKYVFQRDRCTTACYIYWLREPIHRFMIGCCWKVFEGWSVLAAVWDIKHGGVGLLKHWKASLLAVSSYALCYFGAGLLWFAISACCRLWKH